MLKICFQCIYFEALLLTFYILECKKNSHANDGIQPCTYKPKFDIDYYCYIIQLCMSLTIVIFFCGRFLCI